MKSPKVAVAACLAFSLAACLLPHRQARAQDTDPPTVTAIVAKDASGGSTPLPGAALDFAPAEIVVTFSEAIDAATVNTDTFRLVGSGGDGTFTDGNEVEVAPAALTLTTVREATVEVSGRTMGNDTYSFTVSGMSTDAGLVGHWAFDEDTGVSAADSSGNGNDGSVYGAMWQPSGGKMNGALAFDGVDDYVDLGNPVALNLTRDFTIAAWIKLDLISGAHSIVTKVTDDANKQYCLRTADDALKFDYERAGSNYGLLGGVLTANWHHSVVSVDTTLAIRMYVDGDLVASDVAPAETVAVSDPVVVGKLDGAYDQHYFDGLIDDVRIYGRVLPDAEVRMLAALASPVTDLAGNILDGEYVGSLPSGDAVPGGDFVCTFEITAPAVLFTSPGDEAGNVPVTARVEVAFSRGMDEAATQGAFYISGGVTGTPSWNGNALVFAPDASLDYSTYYTVTITTDAVDASGVALASTYTFAFTTAAGPEGGGDSGCAPGSGAPPFTILMSLLSAVACRYRLARKGHGR